MRKYTWFSSTPYMLSIKIVNSLSYLHTLCPGSLANQLGIYKVHGI